MNQRRLTPRDGDTKPCPQCRHTLSYTSRHPVLSGRTIQSSGSGSPDGIRYEPAWVCQNGACDYRELMGDAT